MRPAGNKIKSIFVLAGLFLFSALICAQNDILDSNIKLSGAPLKTSKILEDICKSTGYNFTYDTKVIDTEKRINLTARVCPLKVILDSISEGQSLKYSIIGKHIILFRETASITTDSVPETKVRDLILTGTIVDNGTGNSLSFATIGIRRKGKGTITNNDGNFILKLPADCINDTVSISYVGYSNRYLTVRSLLENDMQIRMDQAFISIPEIIIRAQDPVMIINRAVSHVTANYGDKPAILTGFYREGIFRKAEPQIYSEAVIQVFKSAYNRASFNDQVKVIKSRKIENMSMKDTLAVRLRAGLSTSIVLDGVKNMFDFTDPSRMNCYNYHLRDMVNIDGEKAYVISFEQKPEIEEPLFKGEIYINSEDYGVLLAEFDLNPDLIHLSKESYVSKLPSGYSIKPVSVHYHVRYRKINDRYFLSHIRGDLEFSAKGKRSLFNSRFKVFFEVAYTDYKTDNVERFDRDEITPPYSVFTRTIKGYDSEFWKDFNFLKPEEEISDEIDELKVRLKVSDIPEN